jgi:hypothetical protein
MMEDPSDNATRFEYRALSSAAGADFVTRLNELGRDGWRLVTAHPAPGLWTGILARPLRDTLRKATEVAA